MYDLGTELRCQAAEKPGFVFNSWSVDMVRNLENSPKTFRDATFSITDYGSLTANFTPVKYIEGFIDKMKLKDITLVVHDWGSGLGFHYAMRNEDKISGIAFMESILFPLESWDMFPAADEELLNNAFKARIQATLDCVGIYAKLCHENRTSPVVPFMSLVKSTTSPNC
jgi:pimeloyl-ACP methyl ester carboxylesterase